MAQYTFQWREHFERTFQGPSEPQGWHKSLGFETNNAVCGMAKSSVPPECASSPDSENDRHCVVCHVRIRLVPRQAGAKKSHTFAGDGVQKVLVCPAVRSDQEPLSLPGSLLYSHARGGALPGPLEKKLLSR